MILPDGDNGSLRSVAHRCSNRGFRTLDLDSICTCGSFRVTLSGLIIQRSVGLSLLMNDSQPSLSNFIRQNAPLVLLAAAHLPFLAVYFAGLWRLEHYQFFPFALAAFAWLYLTRAERKPILLSWTGKAALLISIVMLIVSSMAYWPKLTAVSFVFLSFAVTSGTDDAQAPRRLTSLTLLPMILITPPRGLDLHAIFWLQQKTTWLASRVLESLGHLHLQRGNIIELPSRQLMVEEACSGVQSLFTVLFLAILIVCWQRRGLLHTLLLLPTGIAFAGSMNVFRIVMIAVAWQDWKLDLTSGWQHDVLGYFALLLAVLLLLSTDSLLHFLFAPFRDHIYGPFTGLYRNPFTSLWNFVCGGVPRPAASGRSWLPLRLQLGIGASAAVLLGGLQTVLLIAGGIETTTLQKSDPAFFAEDVLPAEIEGFTVVNYSTETRSDNSNWGEFSNLWQCTGHGLSVVVSCDHPFLDWHYLNLCYTGNGWTVLPADELSDDPEWHAATFAMTEDQLGRHGRVIYSHFTADGDPMQPSNPGLSVGYLIDRVRQHAARGLWSLLTDPDNRTTYQVQVFAESGNPVSSEQLTALRRLHLTTRRLLQEHFIAGQAADTTGNTE